MRTCSFSRGRLEPVLVACDLVLLPPNMLIRGLKVIVLWQGNEWFETCATALVLGTSEDGV